MFIQKFKLDIKKKLLLYLAILSIAFLGLVFGMAYSKINEQGLEIVDNNAYGELDRMAGELDVWLEQKVTFFESAANVARLVPDYEKQKELAKLLKETEGFTDIYIGLEDGSMFIDGSGWVPDADWDWKTRPWYKKAVEQNDLIYTKYYIDSSTGKPIISIARPYYENGVFRGVIGGDISLKTLNDLVDNFEIEHGYFFVVDDDTTVLVHPDENLIEKELNSEDFDKTINDFSNEMVKGKRGVMKYEYKGDNKAVYFRPLNEMGLYLGYAITTDVLMAGVNRSNSIMISYLIGGQLIVLVSIYILISRSLKPLNQLKNSIDDLNSGDGDLTKEIKYNKDDEIGEISSSFNTFIRNLRTLISDIKESAEVVSNTAQDLSSSSEEVNASTEQVSASVQEISQGSQNLSESANKTKAEAAKLIESIKQVADFANDSSKSASEATSEALKGKEAAKQAGERMSNLKNSVVTSANVVKDLGNKTEEINKVIDVINSISEETNLLALNAAIEAARAGEAGRGFAVVADEVRKLAEESQKATKQIEVIITELVESAKNAVTSMDSGKKEVEEGSVIVNNALESLEQIGNRVASVNDQVTKISELTSSQISSSQVVEKSVEDVSAVSEESAAGSEEVSASVEQVTSAIQQVSNAAQTLANNSDRLKDLVNRFKV